MPKKHDLGITPYIEKISSRDQSPVRMGTSRVYVQSWCPALSVMARPESPGTPWTRTLTPSSSPTRSSLTTWSMLIRFVRIWGRSAESRRGPGYGSEGIGANVYSGTCDRYHLIMTPASYWPTSIIQGIESTLKVKHQSFLNAQNKEIFSFKCW